MSQLRKEFGDRTRPAHVVLVAGALAGVSEIAATYPLDTIKTHMQVHPSRTTGMYGAATHIMRSSGMIGFYAGLPASLAQVGGKVALRFTAYDKLRSFFKNEKGQISHWGNLAAGTAAGGIEALAWTTPTERIKILQQNDVGREGSAGGRPPSTVARVVNLVRSQGLSSLYVGTVATIWKQSASVGTRFWLYAEVKQRMCGDEAPKVWQTILTGGVVGGISTVFNHPFDVVKSRLQAATTPAEIEKWGGKGGGTFQAIGRIVRHEGWTALGQGLSPRFARISFAQAITFSVYESCLKLYDHMVE